MKLFERTLLIALCAVICVGGCGKQNKPSKLRGMFSKLSSPDKSEMVAMAFDPNDPDRRREGIAMLSRKKWGLEEPYLKGYATLLKSDEDPSVRSVAVRALGRSQDAKYLQNVIDALDDESASVRWDAAVALDTIIGEEAIEPLRTRAVRDESPDVRSVCALALRHYPHAPVIRTLKQGLLDDSFAVRYQAHASLVKIFGRDLGYDPRDWAEDTSRLAKAPEKPKRRWWGWWKKSSPSESEDTGQK
ncbi:MAG: HEAT repeat domain-containing protein [Planctomycetota bacterium]|jgi:HEAT repeat protein